MLPIVAVLAVLAAVAVVVHWTATRVDAIGRRRSFPVAGVASLLVVALVAGWFVMRHARVEARLAAVASVLSDRTVAVRCETLSQAWLDAHGELGYVTFDPDGQPDSLATLTAQSCRDLSHWLGRARADVPLSQVVAVHVLTHEAMHLTGQLDEAAAECEAVQRDASTARMLGAAPDQAAALAVRYWLEVYPRMPDGYRSAGCTAGGAMDEGGGEAPWAPVKGEEESSIDRLQVAVRADDLSGVGTERRSP